MARKDTKLDHLSQVRLFRACSNKELTTIGRASDEVRVPAGKVLTEEGQPGHEFYLVLEGTAAVSRKKRKVATVGPGQYFGEMALLDRGPRSATVTAETPMTLLVLGQREFSGVLDEVPGIAHKLLATMAERLREADTKAVH
ncbi:MAG TPA: cyclic nucleotide-binding domain-containing protein [Acidimicrobiales bacterium]|jgi:CRP/FNR family cyclic AMP-dependent transcriptional regulator|nr:cyclic nucleotide-binding domain-containing protein [Acidimicrobiales bacterium]